MPVLKTNELRVSNAPNCESWVNKELWVNTTMGRGKLPFAPLCGMRLSVSENRIARCAISRPSPDEEAARAIRDGKTGGIDGASRVGCVLSEMHPAKSASAETTRQSKRAAPHPNPYVPLGVFWLPGSRVGGCPLSQSDALYSQTDVHPDANPRLMHFVNKLFADCCTWQKKKFCRPGPCCHFLIN
jgi:hypothetical protein